MGFWWMGQTLAIVLFDDHLDLLHVGVAQNVERHFVEGGDQSHELAQGFVAQLEVVEVVDEDECQDFVDVRCHPHLLIGEEGQEVEEKIDRRELGRLGGGVPDATSEGIDNLL